MPDEIVVLHKNQSKSSRWMFKEYVRHGKTCFVNKFEKNNWASPIPDDCPSLNAFILKKIVEGKNECFYLFDDEWLKKKHLDKMILEDDSWPDYLEPDMLTRLRTAS